MTQDQLKQAVAQAAVDLILPKLDDKSIVGVGTGLTERKFAERAIKRLNSELGRRVGGRTACGAKPRLAPSRGGLRSNRFARISPGAPNK